MLLFASNALLFGGSNKAQVLKRDILQLSQEVARGLTESPVERTRMLSLFEQLEKLNKNKTPLKQPSLADGVWSLQYTTSDSILGRNSYRRVGDIVQKIDTNNLKAENSETIDFFGLKIPRKVTAELSPLTKSKVPRHKCHQVIIPIRRQLLLSQHASFRSLCSSRCLALVLYLSTLRQHLKGNWILLMLTTTLD